jgi:hypothetical protein
MITFTISGVPTYLGKQTAPSGVIICPELAEVNTTYFSSRII